MPELSGSLEEILYLLYLFRLKIGPSALNVEFLYLKKVSGVGGKTY